MEVAPVIELRSTHENEDGLQATKHDDLEYKIHSKSRILSMKSVFHMLAQPSRPVREEAGNTQIREWN